MVILCVIRSIPNKFKSFVPYLQQGQVDTTRQQDSTRPVSYNDRVYNLTGR